MVRPHLEYTHTYIWGQREREKGYKGAYLDGEGVEEGGGEELEAGKEALEILGWTHRGGKTSLWRRKRERENPMLFLEKVRTASDDDDDGLEEDEQGIARADAE